MWVKEPWGMWWQDPRRAEEAKKLGEKWAQEALEKLTREIRGATVRRSAD